MSDHVTKLREWLDEETGGRMPRDVREAGLAVVAELKKAQDDYATARDHYATLLDADCRNIAELKRADKDVGELRAALAEKDRRIAEAAEQVVELSRQRDAAVRERDRLREECEEKAGERLDWHRYRASLRKAEAESNRLRLALSEAQAALRAAEEYLSHPGFGPDAPKVPLVKLLVLIRAALASSPAPERQPPTQEQMETLRRMLRATEVGMASLRDHGYRSPTGKMPMTVQAVYDTRAEEGSALRAVLSYLGVGR